MKAEPTDLGSLLLDLVKELRQAGALLGVVLVILAGGDALGSGDGVGDGAGDEAAEGEKGQEGGLHFGYGVRVLLAC